MTATVLPQARALQILTPVLLAAVAAAYLAFGLLTASYTFGCDFLTYADAADRFLSGQPIYDLSQVRTGECGIFQYPPPFVLLVVPFALVPPLVGAWAWVVLTVVAYLGGLGLMPVRRELKVVVGFIGAIGWPFIYGVRIGQVVPLLFFLFALGWRYLDRPAVVGVASAAGALIKVQPVLLLGWMAARFQWRALAAAILTILTLAVVAAAVGLGGWIDFARLLRNLSAATTVPANVAIGATLYRAGLPEPTAMVIQGANTIVVLAAVLFAARRTTKEAGYLATVVASQIISPIVWDHYALVLLLPVAWLLDRRHWWALAVPISQAWVLLPVAPLTIYPAAYYVLLVGILIVGWRERRGEA
jgi:alpha-1,2-mannosyltransferase